jgi:16S rRNA (uracil1498-N3)-methyltransferase
MIVGPGRRTGPQAACGRLVGLEICAAFPVFPSYNPVGILMSRRRFYMPKSGIRDGVAELTPEQAHHLRRVLRIVNGEQVELFDGEGGVYLGVVETSGARVKVRDLVAISRKEEPVPGIILGVALIKSARFEWMLEKTTELGVQEIVPLETRFSDGRVAEAAGQTRMSRWRRILQQACEQCGRSRLPVLHPPVHISDWLRRSDLQSAQRLLCSAKGSQWGELQVRSAAVAIGIGPEGGWDMPEVSEAKGAGWELLSLGENILRAETAAVAAVSLARLASR